MALVVGNDRYDDLSESEQLDNAVNDARAMKNALEGLNFQVDIGEISIGTNSSTSCRTSALGCNQVI